ncbi:unnamed protein product [Mytilus coruscus]|uniref:Uncharacterized protein n=1 Tax=Mytilus coruscus TaxID=42192 RepID=A0A6J8A383_MYTCO|nr:unnamed protein product [Mytilus coruscus]
MPRKKNCDVVHEGRQSGPCVHCRLHERTDLYIHLVQKKESAPEFYTFVKQIYLIEDEDEKFITTSIEIGPFETIARSNCCICERSTTKLKRVNVEDRLQLFKVYLKEELQHETPDEDGKPIVCLSCYKAFNKYTKSDDQEKSRAKTDMYLTDCLSSIEIMECNISNIDTYCYQNILKYVVSSFLSYKPLLLSKVYNVYVSEVEKAVKDFNLVVNDDRLRIVQYCPTWLFTMLKSCLGPALVLHAGQSKTQGRMIYRLETNLIQCLHSTISDHHKEIDELNNKMSALEKKINSNIASSSSLNTMECLDKTARLMKTHVKLYVQDAIKTPLPDIDCFDLYEEIKKINPTLWNLIYKYSNSSSDLLTINSRLGAGISKDTLKKFITNRVMQLNRDNVISSESFALASFDNLDKNQSYALVGSGKVKSGFHGTTIQAVIPKPSEKNENLDIASHEHTAENELKCLAIEPNNQT